MVSMKSIVVYFCCWFGLVILAIVNGILREKVYAPRLSELSAHQLSTLIFLLFSGLYIWQVTGIFRITSEKHAFVIGGLWLIMTVCFEFIFGHFLMGHSWNRLFHDYNILEGRVWILVLIWTVISPYLFFKIRS